MRLPILNHVKDVFGPSDVYGIKALTEKDTILLRAAVTKNLDPDSEILEGKINSPMQALAWLHPYQIQGGSPGLTFATTLGGSVDFVNEDLRRMLINASYFLLGLDVPTKANVDFIDAFYPSFYSENRRIWKQRKLKITEFELGKTPYYPDFPNNPKWPYRAVPSKEKPLKLRPKMNVGPMKLSMMSPKIQHEKINDKPLKPGAFFFGMKSLVSRKL